MTEEGFKWLMEKGYKTIVDMRVERVKDNIYDAAIDNAILSRKVELVKIPVEVGTAPSMEQVEKFASLVSDSSKKPLYLHSKEGVWRTSAMVSRWRQYMTRSASQFISHQTVSPSDLLLQDINGMGELTASGVKVEGSPLEDEQESMQENLDENRARNRIFDRGVTTNMDKKNQSKGAYKSLKSTKLWNQ